MDRKRKKVLNEILNDYKETNLDDIYKKIEVKFKDDLEKYHKVNDFTELNVGNFIKYIDLDIKNIKYGILVKIVLYNDQKTVKYVYLKNTINKNIWRIKPSKFFIYQRKNKNRSNLSKLIDDFLIKLNDNKK
jgi:hypothetical protein